jgi:putative cell wall-binding protein
VTALEALDIDQVLLVGGTAVLPAALETALAGLGIEVERLAGADRRSTAVAVADYARANLDFVDTLMVLARGDDSADALVGGPRAGRDRAPILLTAGVSELGNATRDYIAASCATLTGGRALGGTQAISASVLSAVAAASRCTQG